MTRRSPVRAVVVRAAGVVDSSTSSLFPGLVNKTNLILGLAAGYHYGDVRPFLMSLAESGFKGECVLFVSDTTRDLDRIATHPVTIIPVERRPRLEEIPFNALRYFLYLEYLRGVGHEYGRILITDVRDVIFQRDPFSFRWPEGINCTLEDKRMTIGTCPHNSHWIREHQGRDALQGVAAAPISCSGTTVGDHESMLTYLEIMTANLLPFKGGERIAGYDQGVHNVLVHTGVLENLTLHTNAGPILTLGYAQGEPRYDQEGFVVNQSGERAHIVHQYDRKPRLHKEVRDRFA